MGSRRARRAALTISSSDAALANSETYLAARGPRWGSNISTMARAHLSLAASTLSGELAADPPALSDAETASSKAAQASRTPALNSGSHARMWLWIAPRPGANSCLEKTLLNTVPSPAPADAGRVTKTFRKKFSTLLWKYWLTMSGRLWRAARRAPFSLRSSSTVLPVACARRR